MIAAAVPTRSHRTSTTSFTTTTTITSTNTTSTITTRRKQKVSEPAHVSEEDDDMADPEEDDDEGEEEDDSVTRCVCGKSHSVGLMVCCDECEVWQHCECMGLDEDDIPEQYFCELCRPADHLEVKGYEKTRRYYRPAVENGNSSSNSSKRKSAKKRTTMNSQDASSSWKEVLQLKAAIERSKTTPDTNHSNNKSTKKATALKEQQEKSTAVTRHQKKRSYTRKPTTETTSPQKEKRTRSRYTPTPSPATHSVNTSITAAHSNNSSNALEDHYLNAPNSSTFASSMTETADTGKRTNHRATTRSRGSTPSYTTTTATSTTAATPTINATNTHHHDQQHSLLSSSSSSQYSQTPSSNQPSEEKHPHPLFRHFHSSARASSPPAKVRMPPQKMTLEEMHKRTNHIFEYLCSIQVDSVLKKNKKKRQRHSYHEPTQHQRHHSRRQPHHPRQEESESEDEDETGEEAFRKRREMLTERMKQLKAKITRDLRQEEEEKEESAAGLTTATTASITVMDEHNSTTGSPSSMKENRKPTPILIPGNMKNNNTVAPRYTLSSHEAHPMEDNDDDSESISSSLSSASTIPLDETQQKHPFHQPTIPSSPGATTHCADKSVAEEAIEKNKKEPVTSADIMESLTRKLIAFQRKFASLNDESTAAATAATAIGSHLSSLSPRLQHASVASMNDHNLIHGNSGSSSPVTRSQGKSALLSDRTCW